MMASSGGAEGGAPSSGEAAAGRGNTGGDTAEAPAAPDNGGSGGDRSAGPAALSQSARVVSSGSNPPTPSKPQQQQQAETTTKPPQQLYFIKTPHDNDVLCGRGGGTNHHPGNKRYRRWVEDRKRDYVNSSKRGKPLLSLGIVEAVRNQNPPGRFLSRDDKTGLWYDIGDQKAREKTGQALREGAPDIRKEIGQPYVHAIVPGESLKAVLTEQDTVGHHSPPKMGDGDGASGDVDVDSSSPSKTLAAMKLGTAPASSTTTGATASKLKRPKSIGSGGGGQRVVSAPVIMGNNTAGPGSSGSSGSMLPPHAHHSQTAFYGSSSRGGKRSTSVPQQMQYGGGYQHYGYSHQYPGYPPHAYHHQQHAPHYYSHQPQQQQQPFPATAAAQWLAGGTGTAPTGPSATTAGAVAIDAVTETAGAASDLAVSDDVTRRLLLSEWIAGGKADGQQLELQRKMEAEADAYRTAGLMGIDPDEITNRLKDGKEGIISIVESHRGKKMVKTTNPAAGGSTSSGESPHAKKRKLNDDIGGADGSKTSEARRRINEALSSMGGF